MNIDLEHQSKGYVDAEYLKQVAILLDDLKKRTYSSMKLQTEQKALDIGCGPGIDTVALAQLVGPLGHVVGIDRDKNMIVEANHHAKEAGVSAWVEHICGDVAILPFEANYFDACRSERVFQHLINPEKVLSEMVRVTKPGGSVVVLDMDWGTFSIDTLEIDIERRLSRFIADQLHYNGYAGRQLYRLFKQEGIIDVVVEAIPLCLTDYTLVKQVTPLVEAEETALSAGAITSNELLSWRKNLEELDAGKTFFFHGTMFIAVGRVF